MIKEVLDVINIFKHISNYKKEKDKEKRVIELFEAYYYFYDIQNDAKMILNEMNQDPIEYIKDLEEDLLEKQLDIWENFLKKQSVRLYLLQNYIYENSFLHVLNPKSIESIKKIVGYKMDTVKTLHGLGAGLFFRNIFQKEEEPIDIAQLVIETLSFDEKFSLEKIKKEIKELESSLNDFSIILKDLLDKDDYLLLSEKARENTLID